MNQTEGKIQAAIVRTLRKYPGVRKCFSIPNEGAGGNVRRMSSLISMGLLSGVSDLEVWLDNTYTVYMEVKAPKGKQSPNQVKFDSDILDEPYRLYCIVHSAEEATEYIDMALGFQAPLIPGA